MFGKVMEASAMAETVAGGATDEVSGSAEHTVALGHKRQDESVDDDSHNCWSVLFWKMTGGGESS